MMQTIIFVRRVWNSDTFTEQFMQKICSQANRFNITIYLQICSKDFFERCTSLGVDIVYVEKWWKKSFLEKKIRNCNVFVFQINDFLRLCNHNNCVLYAQNFDEIKLLNRQAFINYRLTKMLIENLVKNGMFYSCSEIKGLLEEYFHIEKCNVLDIEDERFLEVLDKVQRVKFSNRFLFVYRNCMHYLKKLGYHVASPYGFFSNYVLFHLRRLYLSIIKDNNYRQIVSLKDKYKGQRVFIVATGPSLLEEDVRSLKGEYIIGLNSSWKLFKKLEIVPDFFVVTDPNVFYREFVVNQVELDELSSCRNFFYRMCKNDVRGEKSLLLNICFLDRIYNYGNTSNLYPTWNLEMGLYDLYSVTEDAINIAMYLGFSEIVLLGVDNNYLGEKQHFDNDKKADVNDYFYAKKSQYANNKAYEFLQGVAECRGVKIINATRGGFVEAFQRRELADIIAE